MELILVIVVLVLLFGGGGGYWGRSRGYWCRAPRFVRNGVIQRHAEARAMYVFYQ